MTVDHRHANLLYLHDYFQEQTDHVSYFDLSAID
jgi:hypothetical protein